MANLEKEKLQYVDEYLKKEPDPNIYNFVNSIKFFRLQYLRVAISIFLEESQINTVKDLEDLNATIFEIDGQTYCLDHTASIKSGVKKFIKFGHQGHVELSDDLKISREF